MRPRRTCQMAKCLWLWTILFLASCVFCFLLCTCELLRNKCYSRNLKKKKTYHTIVLISHVSKVMLKILQQQYGLQQYVNWALPDVQDGFRKGRGTRDQIANICWVMKKSRKLYENIYFCFIDYTKTSDCVDHNKLGKLFEEMGVPDHLIYFLRNMYADK